MNVTFQDLQAPENPLNGCPVGPLEVKRLLAPDRAEPRWFELKGDNGQTLTVAVSGRLGAVQCGPESGLPPYLMAVGDSRPEDASVAFPAQGRTRHILARYCLGRAKVEEVVEHFLADGTRLDSVDWEEL